MEYFEIKKDDFIEFYDNLSYVLTDYENSKISDFELYDFMVQLHNKMAEKLN